MPGQNGRRSVLDEVGDIKAPKGSRAWCIAILGETRNTIGMLHADATTAGRRLRALKDVEAWKALGLISWSVLLMQIGLSDDEADGLIFGGPVDGEVDIRAQDNGPLSEKVGDVSEFLDKLVELAPVVIQLDADKNDEDIVEFHPWLGRRNGGRVYPRRYLLVLKIAG